MLHAQNGKLKSIYQDEETPLSIAVSDDKVFLISSQENDQFFLSVYSNDGTRLSFDKLEITSNQSLISFTVVNDYAAALYFNSANNSYKLFTKGKKPQSQVTHISNVSFPEGFKPEKIYFDGNKVFSTGNYIGRIFVTRLENSSFIFSKLLINDQNKLVKALAKNGKLIFIIHSYIDDELKIYSSYSLIEPARTLKVNEDTQVEDLHFSQNLNYAAELFLNKINLYSKSKTISYDLPGDFLLTAIYETTDGVSVVVDKYQNRYKTKAVYEKVKRNNKYEYTTVEKEVFDKRDYTEKMILNFRKGKIEEIIVSTGFTVEDKSVPANKFSVDGNSITNTSFYNSSGISIQFDFNDNRLISNSRITHDGLKKYNGLEAVPTISGWFVMGTQYLYQQNNKKVYNISFYSN
ncbi:hypothetical protein DCC35_02670 [Mangrovivirga cuniculi]|uniref:Uncharacterized protein n=1 Tax=Mangrovivirga cuniculi TaxID=2715131 RepID=A0A4D7JYJ2_9BACT|nr:hypothetical protein DCC35_02670 [Mangrovivirga cuniculi]